MMRPAFVATLAFGAACGGEPKKQPGSSPMPAQAAMMPDTMAKAKADSMRLALVADSVKKAMAVKLPDGRLRDSAFGPKFTVDSTGKVLPVKPPAPKKP